MNPILFVDRDGTIICEPEDHQIDSVDKFDFLDGAISGLKSFLNAGFDLVMVTNQDGLGSASYPQRAFDQMQRLLLSVLASEGISFREILICPHFSSDECACRKPRLGLVKQFLSSHDWDRRRSLVVGDRATDLELAENMGLGSYRLGGDRSWPQLVREVLQSPRTAEVLRQTKETKIRVSVGLDDLSSSAIQTGIGFFDHMLDQLAKHGGMNLQIQAIGDTHIDEHHLVEDVALALGKAIDDALGARRGIGRYGFTLPMDEALATAAIDLSGRPAFVWRGEIPSPSIGGISREMFPHFYKSLADALRMSLHIEVRGENSHHMVESTFKAVGRALRQALSRDGSTAVPSTKGVL